MMFLGAGLGSGGNSGQSTGSRPLVTESKSEDGTTDPCKGGKNAKLLSILSSHFEGLLSRGTGLYKIHAALWDSLPFGFANLSARKRRY